MSIAAAPEAATSAIESAAPAWFGAFTDADAEALFATDPAPASLGVLAVPTPLPLGETAW